MQESGHSGRLQQPFAPPAPIIMMHAETSMTDEIWGGFVCAQSCNLQPLAARAVGTRWDPAVGPPDGVDWVLGLPCLEESWPDHTGTSSTEWDAEILACHSHVVMHHIRAVITCILDNVRRGVQCSSSPRSGRRLCPHCCTWSPPAAQSRHPLPFHSKHGIVETVLGCSPKCQLRTPSDDAACGKSPPAHGADFQCVHVVRLKDLCGVAACGRLPALSAPGWVPVGWGRAATRGIWHSLPLPPLSLPRFLTRVIRLDPAVSRYAQFVIVNRLRELGVHVLLNLAARARPE